MSTMGYGCLTLAGIWYSTYICLPLTTGEVPPGSVRRSTPTQKKLHSAISSGAFAADFPLVGAAASSAGLTIRAMPPAAMKLRRVNWPDFWLRDFVGNSLPLEAGVERSLDAARG